MYRGKLVNWNDDKGFGFISAAELSSNTFIHISTLKHMSRSPKQGDYIYFEVERHEGKTRATNARIEGVAAKKFKTSKSTNKPGANKLVPVLVVGIMSVLLFNYLDFTEQVSNPRAIQQIPDTAFDTTPRQTFKCDGRQYCSQMRSREEAVFFIRNCPNTKMDGDNDGNPCESDSRF
ncbi:cold shock domain-containing protein [Pseudoalteromonas sp. CNC9-20]|uniref:cold shock domain-containing protein n=1 Tax=Pseudoalteromonas sp. CNC9-20 TaxID=2917750 RepID=UPI001EF6C311|nr:cold shock domain-containing protein [Pseudoalteromonas sp. CNC9-20]MCG7568759.1 cold shock domain-containing protein [Pseudoalteromonas sp. CNC9-20]